MSASKQWRVVYDAKNGTRGACFIDAETKEAARAFFEKSFPGSKPLRVTLVPVDPCASYERRGS